MHMMEATIDILYTTGSHTRGETFDEDSDAYQIGRDIRGLGTDAFDAYDIDPQHALDVGYDVLYEFDGRFGDLDQYLEDIYHRLQGPRRDDEIGHDGTETRSMGVGDVIVVDGTVYMVDRMGFTNLTAEYGVDFRTCENCGAHVGDRDTDEGTFCSLACEEEAAGNELETDGGITLDDFDDECSECAALPGDWSCAACHIAGDDELIRPQ